MRTYWSEQEQTYNGEQLKSLYAYMKFGVEGDSVVSWIGPCDIPFTHMADGEDIRAGAEIRGGKMLHFIVEKFAVSLYASVAMQRLLSSLAVDVLRELIMKAFEADAALLLSARLRRDGDDIYFDDPSTGPRKLSISIAAPSFNSCLVHFAVNIVNEGTPVPTVALSDFGIAPVAFAKRLMERFAVEEQSVVFATQKVRGVGSFGANQ